MFLDATRNPQYTESENNELHSLDRPRYPRYSYSLAKPVPNKFKMD